MEKVIEGKLTGKENQQVKTALENVVIDLEKKLKEEIENSEWHQKKFKQSELLVLDIKNTIVELKGIMECQNTNVKSTS